MAKALLIKSTCDKTGPRGSWNKLDESEPTSFIEGIMTNKQGEEIKKEQLSALVSGVPTPWARPKLFKFAFQTLSAEDSNIPKDFALTKFYQILLGEWRGLMALMALYPRRFQISKPIPLQGEGKVNEIAAGFGTMLFEESDLWKNPNEIESDTVPFIQLIYYQHHLIGATSPFTGIFTAVDYDLGSDASDIGWYNKGKLIDPLQYLNPSDLKKLYLFVKNICTNSIDFEELINRHRNGRTRIDLDRGLKKIAIKFRDEIAGKDPANLNRDISGTIAKFVDFAEPFSTLFKADVPVYLKSDNTFTYIKGPYREEITDIQSLLSPANGYVIGWPEAPDVKASLDNSSSYFVRVKDAKTGQKFFFTIPLTSKALTIFKNNIDNLLGYSEGGGNLKLKPKITEQGRLSVSLTIEVDGQETRLNEQEYNIEWVEGMTPKLIMWPNFTSDQWNKYYLYSGFTKDKGIVFDPFFKTREHGFIQNEDKNDFFIPKNYDPQETQHLETNLKCSKLVEYPVNEVESDKPRYDIIHSNKPFAGLKATASVLGQPYEAGYLLIRSSKVEDNNAEFTTKDVVVGFDFGSNNTCVYYKQREQPEPVVFDNLRTMIVGEECNDSKDNASVDELLFISNYKVDNGQIKSWLHEHDGRYVKNHEEKEIAGGVPVYRPNIEVKKMDDYEILTQAGTLHYNMKWLSSDKGMMKKEAYIKTVWLQVCAFLFKKRIKPGFLRWSYPGSMLDSDVTKLGGIFKRLERADMIPFSDTRITVISDTTEAEAVCAYASKQDEFGLSHDNIILGIDVGGSTSDILLLVKDANNTPTLYRESSIRIAAGAFFTAVQTSKPFREALTSFHNSHETRVFCSGIDQILKDEGKQKAPYYLTSIFDQLKTEEFDVFYSFIFRRTRFVFTVPAYVTGFLLFYSGLLIGKTIKDYNLDNIKRVDILTFGKGGRLFHWLESNPGRSAAVKFFEDCLRAGLTMVTGHSIEKIIYHNDGILRKNNKAEVAIGLCKLGSEEEKEITFKDDYKHTDICGEDGVIFKDPNGFEQKLDICTELNAEYFKNNVNGLGLTESESSVFNRFAELFFDFVSVKTDLYNDIRRDLAKELKDLRGRVINEIKSDPEYEKARNDKESFGFHQSILVAEGSSFLKVLINKLFNE